MNAKDENQRKAIKALWNEVNSGTPVDPTTTGNNQPDPLETQVDLALGFLESHRQAEELKDANLEELPSEKAFRKRIAKAERRAKEFLYGMGSGGVFVLGGTTVLLLDPSSFLFAVVGVTGEIAGMAGLGSATVGFIKQQRKRQALTNDFRAREPDQAELSERNSRKRQFGVADWDRKFFALSLFPNMPITDLKSIEVAAKQVVEHEQVGRGSLGSSNFDWRLLPYSRINKKQLNQQVKLFNRLWDFSQQNARSNDLIGLLSKAELDYLSKSKAAPKMLDDWREDRRKKAEYVDRVLDQLKRGYTIDKKGLYGLLHITNTSINELLTWVNMQALPTTPGFPPLGRDQFLERQRLLIDVDGDLFRPGANGSPLLSPEQNRIMRSDYRSSRAVSRWESSNHEQLVALSRLTWFVEANISLPDDIWSAACEWQQVSIEALQVQAQSLEHRAIGTGL